METLKKSLILGGYMLPGEDIEVGIENAKKECKKQIKKIDKLLNGK